MTEVARRGEGSRSVERRSVEAWMTRMVMGEGGWKRGEGRETVK